jgi:plasmid stabilization system protein ParE
VNVLFAATAAQVFRTLPEKTKRQAAYSIELLKRHPKMYPVRRRGLMRGYRYFIADAHLFYYRLSSDEIFLTAIIPGAMRQA